MWSTWMGEIMPADNKAPLQDGVLLQPKIIKTCAVSWPANALGQVSLLRRFGAARPHAIACPGYDPKAIAKRF